MLVGIIKGYYNRDAEALAIDDTVFLELLKVELDNEKHYDRMVPIVEEALLLDTSESNVKEVVLQAKVREKAKELAIAIADGRDHDELLTEYTELKRFSNIDELLERGVEVYEGGDVSDLLDQMIHREGVLAVYPLALNERLDGGLQGSDHMVIFARPEAGKTACELTIANGFARQGAVGIVFNNEERIERLRKRGLSCATGMTFTEMRDNPQAVKDIAEQVGFHNIIFISLSPGTPQQIEAFVERYKPKWFIVDQIRNLAVKSESRTNQLEAAATAVRNIGKKYNAITISITQAGDSAEGKAILEMGDIDYSNTGIPGACDVLLGIGMTEEQKRENIRVMSLSKNKIGGVHDSFPVRFNPHLSKYISHKGG